MSKRSEATEAARSGSRAGSDRGSHCWQESLTETSRTGTDLVTDITVLRRAHHRRLIFGLSSVAVSALGLGLGCALDNRVLMPGSGDAGSRSDTGAPDHEAGSAPPMGVMVCSGRAPATPRITASPDSPASTSPIVFGAVGLPVPVPSVMVAPDGISLGSFHVSAVPGTAPDPDHAWVGFGLAFANPTCVDASAYTGVQFHVTGDMGTCGLRFSVAFSADNSVANGPAGACTINGCTSPSMPVPIGTIAVNFADLSGGFPVDRVDPKTLNDVLWLLDVPTDPGIAGCRAELTLDNIAFFQ
jgi:hypothetical protein